MQMLGTQFRSVKARGCSVRDRPKEPIYIPGCM